jgi:ankyrin repeat protein
VLRHSKKLLPLQRDLRGEVPLEICAQHGDSQSVEAMLQYVKVRGC